MPCMPRSGGRCQPYPTLGAACSHPADRWVPRFREVPTPVGSVKPSEGTKPQSGSHPVIMLKAMENGQPDDLPRTAGWAAWYARPTAFDTVRVKRERRGSGAGAAYPISAASSCRRPWRVTRLADRRFRTDRNTPRGGRKPSRSGSVLPALAALAWRLRCAAHGAC
jgi:hypothetical protein